jgi:histidine triad (HIT) family protein
MASIFTKIIHRELPAYIIDENERFIAFLDINPLRLGHTLVVPKIEVDYIFDLSEKDYSDLFSFANRIAKKIKQNVDCNRIGMSVVGLEVPHAHIHLIPINEISDMNFEKKRRKYSDFEFLSLLERLKK